MERKAKQPGIKLSYVRNGKRYRKTDKQLYNAIKGKLKKSMAFGEGDARAEKKQATRELIALGIDPRELEAAAENTRESRDGFQEDSTLTALGLHEKYYHHVQNAGLAENVYRTSQHSKGAPSLIYIPGEGSNNGKFKEIFGYLPEMDSKTRLPVTDDGGDGSTDDILKFVRFYQYTYPGHMKGVTTPSNVEILQWWREANS